MDKGQVNGPFLHMRISKVNESTSLLKEKEIFYAFDERIFFFFIFKFFATRL